MKIRFHKMHGAGNDYIYVDAAECDLSSLSEQALADLAVLVSDRHKGIGADGLIVIGSAPGADASMRILNADGSEAEMCGNGIRCVAKYLFDRGRCGRTASIMTGAGGRAAEITAAENGKALTVRIGMGRPRLRPEEIPTTLRPSGQSTDAAIIRHPLVFDGACFEITCVSMGNPHCIIFCDDPASIPLHEIGPRIERHAAFPARTNVEFVSVLGPDRLRQRTWERGSGETQACGTGASAVVVAATLCGLVNRRASVELPGGVLEIEWRADDEVFMTGPAVEICEGVVDVDALTRSRN